MGRVAFLLSSLIGLCGCTSEPARKPGPPLSSAQGVDLRDAEKLYRSDPAAFEQRRRELAAEPTSAYWLTRFLVWEVIRVTEQKRSTDEEFLASIGAGEDPELTRALSELRAMGAAAVPAITEDLLRNEFSDRRELGVQVLIHIGDSALVPMRPLLDDRSWRLRRATVRVAAALKSDDSAGFLLLATRDGQFAVRAEAWSALLLRGDAHLAGGRRVLAEDPDPYVRRQVAQRLGGHADRDTAAALVDYYGRCIERGDRRGAEAADASLRQISGHDRAGDLSFWTTWLSSWSGKERG